MSRPLKGQSVAVIGLGSSGVAAAKLALEKGGNVYVSEMLVKETGSIRGSIESGSIEINGHIEGKITADTVVIGKTAIIKGDIFFKGSLKTEEGADIDGYIKRVSNGKSNTEEDIAIEEIVERSEPRNAKIIPVTTHKEAV